MNEREIEVMKLRVQIYNENLEKINNQIISINYSSGFGNVDENTISNIEKLKIEGNRFLKLSESILNDIDEYDTSVIGISVSEINDNKKSFVSNFISLENGLITRYNRDVIKMKKRIEKLKDKALEYSDVVSKIDKIVLPEECSLDINNYNTRLSSKHLDYISLKNVEHEIESIESMLSVKRDKEIDEIEGYIAYFDDRLTSNIPMDLVSLKDLSDKVTKNGISNKITNDEKKINEVLFKLEKLKDKLSDIEYNTYYSVIADKAMGYRRLRQELMGVDVKSYSDELKKEYNLVKSELIEVPKKIEDLMISQILPLTKGGELGEGPRNYYKKIIDSFSSSLLTIEKIIKKCRETGRFEEQLCHNLMVYYNLADKKLNEAKNLVGISLIEEEKHEEEKKSSDIINRKTGKVVGKIRAKEQSKETENSINVSTSNLDDDTDKKEDRKPLQVVETKKVSKSFMDRFSKGGLLALGFSVLCVSIHSPLGSLLIPALILGNAAYAIKEPILKPVNDILGRSIGAKKNERDEWINSNGTVMNTSTSLLKSIAASGTEKVSVIKKMVSGVKDLSNKIPKFEDKKVVSLYKEYSEIIDKISLEEFCNDKKIGGTLKDKFIKYVDNMEYNEVEGRSK